ncbi:hypothetical protein QE152_g917 [Popillia japonica]|uniref:Uncharacterized protein n=1 Tax=Popillia japonica TaxID=7064 RepID=A0AAW1NE36_POPJA
MVQLIAVRILARAPERRLLLKRRREEAMNVSHRMGTIPARYRRAAGNEGALAGSMEPPGWACAQTQGASLVR